MNLNRSSFFLTLLFGMFAASISMSQIKDDSTDGEHNELTIVKSVGFSIKGFVHRTQFRLKDEAGVQYDLMSLLETKSACDDIGLTAQQTDDLARLHSERNKELTGEFAKSLLQEEKLDRIKQRFFEIEDEMLNQLSVEQVDRLFKYRLQKGFDQVGHEYLTEPAILQRLGLQAGTGKKLAAELNRLNKNNVKRRAHLLRKANLALISEMPAEKQEELKKQLGSQSEFDEFLESSMFAARNLPSKLPPVKSIDRNRILRLKKTRAEIGMSQRQSEETRESIAKNESDVFNSLSEQQQRKLQQMIVKKDVLKKGTAASICYGELAESLSLADQDRQELFEFGKQLHQVLLRDLKNYERRQIQNLDYTKANVSEHLE